MAVIIDKDLCTGCGVCTETCPVTALAVEDDKVCVNDECIDCGACVSECPFNALSL